jgi:hypothetical protein
LTPSNRAYLERFLTNVEAKRSRPYCGADVERLLTEMQSDDERTRANAVRQICPCRMPGEVFHRLRKAAKRLQHDSSPMVRANALHIEEDARMVASIEGELERVREYEDRKETEALPKQRGKRGRRQKEA